MGDIEVVDTGLVYGNPKPHVHSIHAYFPSIVALPNGQMLASIVLGEAFEAPNLRTHVCRSGDGGRTWSPPQPIYPGAAEGIFSDAARLTALPGGRVVAFMVRHDRTGHPEEGLTNPETLGFVPTELCLLRSDDAGATWSLPEPFAPPLEGPSFELCSPITPLRDGTWLLPTSTWQGWDGYCPNGTQMVVLVSRDQGRSWPEYYPVMAHARRRVHFWESKVVELPDGRLLAVAWAYDADAAQDLPNHFALSSDGGQTWSTPASTGLHGQTLTPLVLDDGRILCVYRRMDEPGLWAVTASLDGGQWRNEEHTPLWGAQAAGLTASTENMAHNFNVLRFGAPCLTRLEDGHVFLAFWCYEDCVSVIRWIRLRVP